MFGGWTAAILLRAAMDDGGRNGSPVALNVNFIAKVEADSDVDVRARYVGGGTSLQHWQATMSDSDGRGLAQATITFANRRESDGFTEDAMPEVPEPMTLEERHPPGRAGERISVRPIFGIPLSGPGSSRSAMWVREVSGRPVDHLQLAFLCDNYAPRISSVSGPRASSTVTLNAYFLATETELARIGDDYLLGEYSGTRAAKSTCGQQARLWSRRGELLLTSEQLHWYQ
jgi:acyl-CoA thioesterase